MPPTILPPTLRQLATMSGQANAVSALTGQLQNDTGWISPNLENGWTKFAAAERPPVGYRVVGNEVTLRGTLARTAESGKQLFLLPTSYAPPFCVLYGAYPPATDGMVVFINPAGNVLVFFSGTPEQIGLDGVSFFLN